MTIARFYCCCSCWLCKFGTHCPVCWLDQTTRSDQ